MENSISLRLAATPCIQSICTWLAPCYITHHCQNVIPADSCCWFGRTLVIEPRTTKLTELSVTFEWCYDKTNIFFTAWPVNETSHICRFANGSTRQQNYDRRCKKNKWVQMKQVQMRFRRRTRNKANAFQSYWSWNICHSQIVPWMTIDPQCQCPNQWFTFYVSFSAVSYSRVISAVLLGFIWIFECIWYY